MKEIKKIMIIACAAVVLSGCVRDLDHLVTIADQAGRIASCQALVAKCIEYIDRAPTKGAAEQAARSCEASWKLRECTEILRKTFREARRLW